MSDAFGYVACCRKANITRSRMSSRSLRVSDGSLDWCICNISGLCLGLDFFCWTRMRMLNQFGKFSVFFQVKECFLVFVARDFFTPFKLFADLLSQSLPYIRRSRSLPFMCLPRWSARSQLQRYSLRIRFKGPEANATGSGRSAKLPGTGVQSQQCGNRPLVVVYSVH